MSRENPKFHVQSGLKFAYQGAQNIYFRYSNLGVQKTHKSEFEVIQEGGE